MIDLNLFIDVLNNEVLIDSYAEKLTKSEIAENKFILHETHKDAKCKNAPFKGENCNSLSIFKFDKIVSTNGITLQHPFLFFRENNVRTLNDYLIFYPAVKNNQQYLFVVICNMKSINPDNNIPQLSAGEDFSKYLVASTFRMAKNSDLRSKYKIKNNHNIQDNIKVRYVKLLFSCRNRHNRQMNVGLQSRTSANYNINSEGYVDLLCNGIQICDLDTLVATLRNKTR